MSYKLWRVLFHLPSVSILCKNSYIFFSRPLLNLCLTWSDSIISNILPLLSEGTKKGSDTASVSIRDSPNAAKSAVFLSKVDTLLTDEEVDKETKLELKEVSTAGRDCEETVPVSIEVIADGLDKITEFCWSADEPQMLVYSQELRKTCWECFQECYTIY